MTLIEQLCPQPPRLLMFDLDGTLVDSVPDLSAAVDAMLQDIGRAAAGQAKVRHWVGNGAAMLIKRALSNAMQPKDIEQALFHEAQALFFKHYEALSGTQSKLYPGVADTLAVLRARYPHLAVITNKPEQFTQSLLDHLALPRFDMVICGDTLSNKKPHPAPLLHCLKQFDCDTDSALMIGDSLSDIQAAKSAGVPVACVSYGYNQGLDLSSYAPEAMIEHFGELLLTS